MIRFIFCIIIVILAFLLFLNADRFMPDTVVDPTDPVTEPDPVEPEPEPDPVEPEPDPIEPEPVEPEPDPDPEPPADVLTDADGNVFSYLPAGALIANSHPPSITVDNVVYDDQITFPAEDPVFLNSQKWRYGGDMSHQNGMAGGQCNADNYAYPWQDNFCEKRWKNQYFCASGGHTGVDIRPASCTDRAHWVVAPEAGVIIGVGSYGVRLMSDDGTWYQFLHMAMDELAVIEGQDVVAGQRLGKMSNVYFDGNGNMVPTTIHMHMDMKESYAPTNGEEPFIDRVNPYMTLVAAYERKLREAAETP